ncbi:MAG: AAA family ATPase [Myxococcales bacterium]|nr:AAA family ATPase [Myxococcales bacterium]
MRIAKLSASNYRTLENLDIEFLSFYTALCGRNDAGKTNVVRAIRCLMKEEDPFGYATGEEFSLTDDYTKWRDDDVSEREITVELSLLVHRNHDAGLYEFISDYLDLKSSGDELAVSISQATCAEPKGASMTVRVEGEEVAGLRGQEIASKIRTGRIVLFHVSTEPTDPFARGFRGMLQEISPEYTSKLSDVQKRATNLLKKIARDQQQELSALLSRLETKYEVGLSLPALDFSRLPFDLTLSDRKIEVELDNWGSGTRNRTLILLTLFRARQIAEGGTSARKITPVIVVEEPESFLHPSAQAEFGRVLQNLAEEFQVQLIVTTHSPYLLSHARPDSNLLLDRRTYRNKLLETRLCDTSGPKWMEPFGLALGVDNAEFEPWRDLFFGQSEGILLVEGDVDKLYFELLRSDIHGANKLQFSGDIFPYGGRDNLKNTPLLRFIKEKYKKTFITFDLDSLEIVEPTLQSLGFQKKADYVPVGVDAAGQRAIEGLLPETIRSEVRVENSALVDALSGTKEERKSAQGKLKRLMYGKFRDQAKPESGDYDQFYSLVKHLNKALA